MKRFSQSEPEECRAGLPFTSINAKLVIRFSKSADAIVITTGRGGIKWGKLGAGYMQGTLGILVKLG